MSSFLTLGKIVIADTQQAARELFSNRHKTRTGGVIFTPDFEIPDWTDDEKIALSKFYCQTAETEDVDPRTAKSPDWPESAQNIVRNLVKLSREFNETADLRTMRFLWNNDLNTQPHFDLPATHGWAHLNLSRRGLLCANPVGDEPVKVKVTGAFGDNLDLEDFNRLVNEGRIELIELKEKQAIVFDHTMGHLSNYNKDAEPQQDKRFRIPVFTMAE